MQRSGVMQTLADMVQQSVTGVFDQIEHLIEAILAAVIRIRHHRSVMLAAKFSQSTDFVTHRGRTSMLGQCQIIPVHRQQQIMADKIVLPYLAGPQVG